MKRKILVLMAGLCAICASLPAADTIRYQGKTFLKTKTVYKQTKTRPLSLSCIHQQHPLRKGKMPAVIFFFGGGWNSGTPDQFLQQALYLADKGMIAVLADYRTKNKDGVTPAECISDAKSAMRYLKAHAGELGIDTARIAASGGSAGGHLAIATATIRAFNAPEDDLSISPVPSALVLFNPVLDNGPDGGYGYERVKAYYQDFSPAHNIRPNMPPTLVMLGNKDHLIPTSTMLRFQEQMTEKGNICHVSFYSAQKHGFFNYREGSDNRFFRLTMDETVAFLKFLKFID